MPQCPKCGTSHSGSGSNYHYQAWLLSEKNSKKTATDAGVDSREHNFLMAYRMERRTEYRQDHLSSHRKEPVTWRQALSSPNAVNKARLSASA